MPASTYAGDMDETIIAAATTFRVRATNAGFVIEKCHPITHRWTFVELCAEAPAAIAFYTFLLAHAG